MYGAQAGILIWVIIALQILQNKFSLEAFSQQSMSMPIILVGVVGVILGLFVGYLYRKQVAEKEIGSAEQEATRIVNDAIKSAETKKREAILEAKDEILKNRTEAEREIKERRNEDHKTGASSPPEGGDAGPQNRCAGPKE